MIHENKGFIFSLFLQRKKQLEKCYSSVDGLIEIKVTEVHPGDGDSEVFRHIGIQIHQYTAFQPRSPHLEYSSP
jgi:hypothetical protein